LPFNFQKLKPDYCRRLRIGHW